MADTRNTGSAGRWPLYTNYIATASDELLHSAEETLVKHLDEHLRRVNECSDKIDIIRRERMYRKDQKDLFVDGT